MAELPTAALTRRDRLRAATTAEIIQTARRLLVTRGTDAVSLRAIAREMGMTAPALYRYFDSHEELIRRVIAEMFTELGHCLSRAVHDSEAVGEPDYRRKMTLKVVAVCREFRRWSLEHKAEFGLLFGVPLPGIDDGRSDVATECALNVADVFFGLFLELWGHAPFDVPAAEEIDPALLGQLDRYQAWLGSDLPPGAVLAFLRCWVVLHGAVSIEVFGHMDFALEDASPMFEYTLADLARLVGLRYPPES